MFTNKLNTSRSRHNHSISDTPSKKRNFNIQSLQRSSLFSPSSQKQTHDQSLLQSSQQPSSNTAKHRLDPFGAPLSVLVTEALALSHQGVSVPDVELSKNGWAWLVAGKKLHVWKYAPHNTIKAATCKELALPASYAPYTSRMVCVLPSQADGPSLPACIVVSAEGVVRFWSSIANETTYVELIIDAKGQRCMDIIALKSVGCIIATNHSSLYCVSASKQSGLAYRELHNTRGMLAGFGRKVSSLFFGSTPQNTAIDLQRILPGDTLGDGTDSFYVLAGEYVEKWIISANSEKLLYQCEAGRLMRECVSEAIWKQDQSRLPQLKIWLLDFQATRDGLVLLGAAVNTEVSDQLHYVLGTLHTEGVDSPQSFLSFAVQQFTNTYRANNGNELDYHLLIADMIGNSAYIYTDKSVICTSVTSSEYNVDHVDFTSPRDSILGSGSYEGLALFFSTRHSIVAIHDTAATVFNSSKFEPATPNASEVSSIYVPQTTLAEMSESDDGVSKLKAAFIQYTRGNQEQVAELVSQLTDSCGVSGASESTMLDTLVTTLSQQLIDDFPAADPRWADSIPHDTASSTSSLILLQQLADKLKSHQLYVAFLKACNLWDQLGCVRLRKTLMCTSFVLCEHAEKITATMSLRELHAQYQHQIDKAMVSVLKDRGDATPPSGLTHQDLFYRQVSRVQDILDVLQKQQDDAISSDISPSEAVKHITAVNHIFISMLQAAVQYRESQTSMFVSTSPDSSDIDYLPWTSSLGPDGIRSVLAKQHDLTCRRAVPLAQDVSIRGDLYEQILQITDLLLDSYCSQIQKLKANSPRLPELTQAYHKHRQALIQPLMVFEQYERAASLAEKYCEFDVLVQLCEQTNNQDRLNRYLHQFHNKDFAEFVFNWYVKKGKRSKLLSTPLSTHPQLGRFLHSSENSFISWVHDLSNNDYLHAHETLHDLATKESDNLSRKKTLYSLSKLCALATEETSADLPERVNSVNKAHDLILQQEALPPEVIENLGMDADNMKVLQPRELIELYVGDYNTNSNEYDFKKALDLVASLELPSTDPEYTDILLHIWSRAILKDEWAKMALTDPLDSCKETVFFKTIELAYTQGMNLQECLPAVDVLLQSEELSSIADNTTFLFLLKAGYEKLKTIMY